MFHRRHFGRVGMVSMLRWCRSPCFHRQLDLPLRLAVPLQQLLIALVLLFGVVVFRTIGLALGGPSRQGSRANFRIAQTSLGPSWTAPNSPQHPLPNPRCIDSMRVPTSRGCHRFWCQQPDIASAQATNIGAFESSAIPPTYRSPIHIHCDQGLVVSLVSLRLGLCTSHYHAMCRSATMSGAGSTQWASTGSSCGRPAHHLILCKTGSACWTVRLDAHQ